MNWWRERREARQRLARAKESWATRESLRAAFTPLTETSISWKDLSVCFACGQLFLTSLEGVHIAQHEWRHQTNPVSITGPIEIKS